MSLTWNWVKQPYYLWKQASPAVPVTITSSITSNHWYRLGNSMKAVLCLLWNPIHRHTLPAECWIVMTPESLNILHTVGSSFYMTSFSSGFSTSFFSLSLQPTEWKCQECSQTHSPGHIHLILCDIHLLSYLQRYLWSLFQFCPN